MPHRHTPPVLPTLFPMESHARDWTGTGCVALTAVGVGYFAIHFAIAAARGLLS